MATFSQTVGTLNLLTLSDFVIDTDTSIWPFQSHTIDRGTFAKKSATNYPMAINSAGNYITYGVVKSTDEYYYNRKVQKISEVFSFVGGLIGAGTAVLFFINYYTDFSLEVLISASIFKKKKEEPDLGPDPHENSDN